MKRTRYPILAITGFIILLLTSSCKPSSPTETPVIRLIPRCKPTKTPGFQPSPTPFSPLDFVVHTYPRRDGYDVQWGRGESPIRVTLDIDVVSAPGETLSYEEMQDRIELLIDDEQQFDVIYEEGIEPDRQLSVIRAFAAGPGEHEVTIRARRSSGDVLEYSWMFTALVEEPDLPGLPEGLQFVRPLPDSTITEQAYQDERLVPEQYSFGPGELPGRVCVAVRPEVLVRPGEFLTEDDLWERYSFVSLDSLLSDEICCSEEWNSELYENPIFDEDGHTIASVAGPHSRKCCRVDLAPGEHEVTVQVQKASGNLIQYTWQFTITED